MSQLRSDNELYAALLARDASYEDVAWVAVRTTRIVCRLTCPARKPKRRNVQFYDSLDAAIADGYRPCLRCRPAAPANSDPLAERLLALIESDPLRRWYEADVRRLGIDPATARRAFQRRFGLSFLAYARTRRLGAAHDCLLRGASVIDVQIESGFQSGSGFRDAMVKLHGVAPASVRRASLSTAS
jgi:AraC family transcriptional regulator of adaptative response/methylated-DNA-[protein]-cysteine methyltransferase